MFALFGFIFLGLALAIMAVCIISVSWWFILPAIIILSLSIKLVKALGKAFGKKEEIVTMSRSEFERNYQRRAD